MPEMTTTMMTTAAFDAIVLESLAEALETMAFVALMPAAEPTEPADGCVVSIEFARPERGVLELVAPRALGTLLAANVLGTDPSDPEAVARGDDALREAVNVACGAMLRRLKDLGEGLSTTGLHMGLPEMRPLGEGEWATVSMSAGVAVLDADGNVIAVRAKGLE